MISLIAGWTSDMWLPVINLFSFIPNYAWMILVFTVVLKIVLSPLDFWQRKVSRDSMKKQARLQPEMQKIQKKYANDKQQLNQKTMELYKRENYNVVGSCLSMIVNMGLTLFIFITLFTGLSEIAQQKIYTQYTELQDSYYASYNADFVSDYSIDTTGLNDEEIQTAINTKLQDLINAEKPQAEADLINEHADNLEYIPTQDEIDARAKAMVLGSTTMTTITTTAQEAVLVKYDQIKDSWLWVKNIWRPDTSVASFPDYDTFVNISNVKTQSFYTNVVNSTTLSADEINAIKAQWQDEYKTVTAKILTENTGWNGYYILVILAALITYFSADFSQKQSLKKKKDEAVDENPTASATKLMKWFLPVIMVIFTLSYSGAFAIYIVINSLMSFIFSIIALEVFSRQDEKKEKLNKINNKVDYSR